MTSELERRQLRLFNHSRDEAQPQHHNPRQTDDNEFLVIFSRKFRISLVNGR